MNGIRIVLMGPPGAGKGTQATRLAQALNVPAISTGEIFRSNLKAGTALGQRARQYMDAGEYVPDHVTNDMVQTRLSEDDAAGGWLLDGYPRTLEQVHTLDRLVAESGHRIDRVIALEVDGEELVRRLLARAVVEGRQDDTDEVIRCRQRIYSSETAPLLAEYRSKGLLSTIDGGRSVDEVHYALCAVVDALPSRRPASPAVSS